MPEMQEPCRSSRRLYQSTQSPTRPGSSEDGASKNTDTLALDAAAPEDPHLKQRCTTSAKGDTGFLVRLPSDAASQLDSSRKSGSSFRWKSPFAYVDPMSVDIDTASTLISRPDDTLVLRDTIISPYSKDFEEDISRPDFDATPSNSLIGDGGQHDLSITPVARIEETLLQSRHDSILRAHSMSDSGRNPGKSSNAAGAAISLNCDDASSCTRSCLTEETRGTSVVSDGEEADSHAPTRTHDSTAAREGSVTQLGLEYQSDSKVVKTFGNDASLTKAHTSAANDSTQACDLLELLVSKTAQKGIPKAAAMSRKGMTCFTCSDIFCLITTIRSCLRRLKFEWSEFSMAQSVGFRASYDFDSRDNRSAARHEFDILLFRLKFRSGYGADICPNGISTAKFSQAGSCCDEAVQGDEVKRIRELIRAYLDAALARKEEAEMRGTIVPLSVNGAGPIGLRGTQCTRPKVASGSASLSSKTESFAS